MRGLSSPRRPRAVAVAALMLVLGAACEPSPSPGASSEPPLCQGRMATIVGTPQRDVLPGTAGRDVLAGLGGNDLLLGEAGDDLMCGGAGDDTLQGGPGADSLTGGADRDTCQQGPGLGSSVECEDPVLLAAGDIACDPADPTFGAGSERSCRQGATSDILVTAQERGSNLAVVLALGDTQYATGSPQGYLASYDPSWGRVKDITRPVLGNNEYETPDASGYFAYFGAAAGAPSRGYYSFDVGDWHLVALNSLCWKVGGCGPDDRQARWLQRDLAEADTHCTLAYFHHPRFSSSAPAPNDSVEAIWDVLYANGVELVLNGHNHHYERFAPQDPNGTRDPEGGIRQFVVGTGGVNLHPFSELSDPRENSEMRNAETFGVLEITLFPEGYEWRFLPIEGTGFTDAGEGSCR